MRVVKTKRRVVGTLKKVQMRVQHLNGVKVVVEAGELAQTIWLDIRRISGETKAIGTKADLPVGMRNLLIMKRLVKVAKTKEKMVGTVKELQMEV